MGRYPNGKGSYAQKRANDELMIYLGELENRIKVLEDAQTVLLKENKGSIENEILKVKKLADFKKTELKSLSDELGINDTDFKNKEDYITALKEKDPTLE